MLPHVGKIVLNYQQPTIGCVPRQLEHVALCS